MNLNPHAAATVPRKVEIIWLRVQTTLTKTKWEIEKEFVPPLSIRPMCSAIENQSEKTENETLAVLCVIFWAYESIFWFRADIAAIT